MWKHVLRNEQSPNDSEQHRQGRLHFTRPLGPRMREREDLHTTLVVLQQTFSPSSVRQGLSSNGGNTKRQKFNQSLVIGTNYRNSVY